MTQDSISTRNLRQAVYDRMADEWGLEYDLKLAKQLWVLVGRQRSLNYFIEEMTEPEIEICKKLLSEHGYAYYKMLLVQRELPDG